jgi:hypothetical protein
MALKSTRTLGKVVFLSLFVLGISSAADDLNNSYNAGIGAADQSKSVLTSGQRDKLYAPLTSDTQMTTLDGSKSGKVKFGCKDATTFKLDFYFVPKGNNTYGLIVKKGDGIVLLNTDNVSYQDNAGTHTGIAISGVCDNGIAYCKDGVWDSQHCYYFKYVADSNGNLSLSQVWLKDSSSRDLGQCSCTDASCGWVNIVPYSYVVGGISAALMSANPKYQMSSGNWDSSQFKYTYYGMDNSNCTAASGNPYSPGDDNPSRFYSPGGGDVDRGTVDSVIAQQSSNNNSPYSIATKLQNVQYDKNGTTIQVSKPNLPYCFVNSDIGIQQEIVDPVLKSCKLKSGWVDYHNGCAFGFVCNSDGTSCVGNNMAHGCFNDGQYASVSISGLTVTWFGEWYGDDWDRPASVTTTLNQCGDISQFLYYAIGSYPATPVYNCSPVCPSGYNGPYYDSQTRSYYCIKGLTKVSAQYPCSPSSYTCSGGGGLFRWGNAILIGTTCYTTNWTATIYAYTDPIYTCPPGYTMVGSSCKRDKAVLVSNDGCTPYKSKSECHVYNKWICKRGETNQQNCINASFSSSDFQSPPNQMVRNSAKISDGSNYPVQCYNTSTDVAAYQICESPTSALVYRTTQVLASDGSAALNYSPNSPASAAAAGNGSFSVLDGRFTVLYQYQCDTSTGVDIERSKATMASLSMNGNTATFSDPAHPEKGTQTLTTPKISSCLDTFCLVKETGSTTEVNSDSTNKGQTQGGTTVLYDKRRCERTSNLKYNDNTTPSFTCPVNTGETILANCDCEENIDALTNHTISVLEAVDQMTKDWICSSN